MSSETVETPETNLPDLPLQNAWTFWYDRYQGPGQTADQYQQGQRALYDCDTVQSFWKCFQITSPESLEFKSSLHMMKKGIHPIWEDPENETGGFWVLRFGMDQIGPVWRELCLAAIGENFYNVLQPGDAINGITVSIRRADAVIQVWHKITADEPDAQRIINHVVKSVLSDFKIENPWFYKSCKASTDTPAQEKPQQQQTQQKSNQPRRNQNH